MRTQTIWSAWVRKHRHTQLYASLHYIDAVRSRTKPEHSCLQLDLERNQSTAALSKQKRNSLVAILQSALILWDLSVWGGEGVASSMRLIQHLVWRSIFVVVFCLLNTESDLVYLELSLASGPRVQSIFSKLHKALFQLVLGTSDFIFYLYWGNVYQ